MCSLLFLSCIALALPTASRHLYTAKQFTEADLTHISHGTALMLVGVYAAFLYFQVRRAFFELQLSLKPAPVC